MVQLLCFACEPKGTATPPVVIKPTGTARGEALPPCRSCGPKGAGGRRVVAPPVVRLWDWWRHPQESFPWPVAWSQACSLMAAENLECASPPNEGGLAFQRSDFRGREEILFQLTGGFGGHVSRAFLWDPAAARLTSLEEFDLWGCEQLAIPGADVLICPEFSGAERRRDNIRMDVVDLCGGERKKLFEISDNSFAACAPGWQDRIWALRGGEEWTHSSNVLTWLFVVHEAEERKDWPEACPSREYAESSEDFLAEHLGPSKVHGLQFTVANGEIAPTDEARALAKRFGGSAYKVIIDPARRCSEAPLLTAATPQEGQGSAP